jgi:hypothetical protein
LRWKNRGVGNEKLMSMGGATREKGDKFPHFSGLDKVEKSPIYAVVLQLTDSPLESVVTPLRGYYQ